MLAAAACGETGERSVAWSGSADTLPNGAVRVDNPRVGLWEVGAETPWKLVPETEIGALQGDPETVFSTVSGLAVDGESRILAIDRDTKELRFYAADGTYLRSVGGEGEGPGEYTGANGLVRLPSDSLLVVDQEGARYTVLGPEGEFGRTIQRRLPFYGWVFEGGVDHGRVYERFRVGRGEEAEAALFGTELRNSGAPLDTVMLPAVREPPLEIEPFKVETERFSSYMQVPFTPEHVYLLDGEGGVWFGRGDRFHLYHVTLAGDTLREIALETDPAPVTDAELAEWRQSEFVQDFENDGGEIDESRVPATKPYFDGLALDPDGNLWVSTPTGPNEFGFAVFDPDGRYLGRLGFSGAERIGWVDPVIHDGRLYVVTQDDLGVNRIRVFRIERDVEALESAEG